MSQKFDQDVEIKLSIAEKMLKGGATINFVLDTTELPIEIVKERFPVIFAYQHGFDDGKKTTEKKILEAMIRIGLSNEEIFRMSGIERIRIRRFRYAVDALENIKK